VVLPCGAGKTVVGLAAMELVGQTTLVLTTSLTSVKQWRREILDKTTLHPDDIAEYTGDQKNTGPVTLATYQILTWRENRESAFPHLELFRARSWGLIIYDEVHLLPAPVFARQRIFRPAAVSVSRRPSCERTDARQTSSLSSGPNASMFPGKTWNGRHGLRAPPASRNACR